MIGNGPPTQQGDIPSSYEPSELFPRVVQHFKEHTPIVLTLLYVHVSIIGIVYTWALFRHFDISIMDFSETNDFVAAALKQPGAVSIFAYSWVLSMIVAFGTRRLSWRLSSRYRRSSDLRKRHDYWLYLALILFTVAFGCIMTGLSSIYDARELKRGRGPRVFVELRSQDSRGVPKELEDHVFLIGTTEKFAFFYSTAEDRTHIIPNAAILRIVPLGHTEVRTPSTDGYNGTLDGGAVALGGKP